MVTIETPTQWMSLGLSFHQKGNKVVFAITFSNTADTPQELVFSNRAHKAELLGLRIFDALGKRVEPIRKFILNPLPDPDGRRWLQPCEQWTYELKGILTNDGLEFPATRFSLAQNRPYQARFVYKLISSNEVAFMPGLEA